MVIPRGKNRKNIGMWDGVRAVSRTAVWCQEPSWLGQKLAMMYRITLVIPTSPQNTAIRRTSSAWVASRSTTLRPRRTR